MKYDRLRVIVVLQSLLLAGLIIVIAYLGRDELKSAREDQPPARSPVASTPVSAPVSEQGTPVVSVTNALRQGSGIEMQAIRTGRAATSKPLPGVVVSAQAVLEQLGRWRAAQTDNAAAEVEARRANSEYERIKALYKDDRNASERALQAADATFETASTRAAASRLALQAERTRMMNDWGIDPVNGASQRGRPASQPSKSRQPASTTSQPANTTRPLPAGAASALINALIAQRQVLLQVAVEPGEQTAPPRISVRPAGGGDAREARLIGPSARPEAGLSGATFLYAADAAGLRSGMRVIAQVPDQASGQAPAQASAQPSNGTAARGGFIVPGSALVWHAGRVWVYAKIPEAKQDDDEKFARRDVSAGEWQGEGWFTSALAPDTEVVTRGAQLLLSEEQRGSIKNENDD